MYILHVERASDFNNYSESFDYSLFGNCEIISKLKVKPKKTGSLPWPMGICHLPSQPASLSVQLHRAGRLSVFPY